MYLQSYMKTRRASGVANYKPDFFDYLVKAITYLKLILLK